MEEWHRIIEALDDETIPADLVAYAAEKAFRRGFQHGVMMGKLHPERDPFDDASEFRTSFRLADHAVSPTSPDWKRERKFKNCPLGTIRQRQINMELPGLYLNEDGTATAEQVRRQR